MSKCHLGNHMSTTSPLQITDLDYFYGPSLEVFGGASNNKGSFEMYLALPYMAIVMEKTSDMNNDGTKHKLRWQDSIMDQLVQHGIAKWDSDNMVSTESNDFDHQPLSHNLINNGFMQYKNGKKPAGFNKGQYRCSGCKLNLEAVHPFTKVSSGGGGGVVLRAHLGYYRCHIQDSNWACVFLLLTVSTV